jgi:hypothetical protein
MPSNGPQRGTSANCKAKEIGRTGEKRKEMQTKGESYGTDDRGKDEEIK